MISSEYLLTILVSVCLLCSPYAAAIAASDDEDDDDVEEEEDVDEVDNPDS